MQNQQSGYSYLKPTTPKAPKAEPTALADSVTVRAGVVAVREWMAEGKAKG